MCYSSVSNYFYFSLGSTSAGRCAQTLEEWLILSTLAVWVLLFKFFSRLGKLSSGLHYNWYEMIKVSHAVASPVAFIFFSDRRRHEGLLKLLKNDYFQQFSTVVFCFLKILGRCRRRL